MKKIATDSDKEALAPHPVLDQYYKDSQQRRPFVSWLFDETAGHYDWIIRAMSFGSGNWYRKQALERAGLAAGMHVLDIATGTGPVAASEKAIVGPSGSVIGLDRSFNMLLEARKRVAVPVVHAAAEFTPFPAQHFDFLSMGYALRHVDDLYKTFEEYFRVLKPGGKVLILELTRPKSAAGLKFLRFYLNRVVPWMARVGSRTRNAETLMKYFWDTIEQCVPPEAILKAMEAAGFVHSKRHTVFGIFSEYTAVKP